MRGRGGDRQRRRKEEIDKRIDREGRWRQTEKEKGRDRQTDRLRWRGGDKQRRRKRKEEIDKRID